LRKMLSRGEFLTGLGAMALTPALVATQARAVVRRKRWIMSDETFEHCIGGDSQLAAAMQGTICYVQGEGEGYGLRRINSNIRRDLEEIENMVSSGEVVAGENMVFAIENGTPQTPVEQQLNLAYTCRRAAEVLHSVGATLITAPASSILDNLAPNYDGPEFQKMLELRVFAKCARHADGIDIQAQQCEQNVEVYEENIRKAAAQARNENPAVKVFAGLTTNSKKSRPDDYPTAREIYRAAKAVKPVVDGYWMNVPPHRETGIRNPEKARKALRLFYGLEI
jgi:hypothetical protein